jgi:predicted  nucleic acid-binding Zn-ribbon protein
VESAAIAREIAELERELSSLRSRVEEDNSSFTTLEQQIAQLRESLTQTQDTMRMQELRLAEKQVALADAQRLERLDSYEQDLGSYRDARGRVSEAASAFLAELETYDGEVINLRKLLDEMRAAFGSDERVAEVETALDEEAQELNDSWKAVVNASQWRIAEPTHTEEDEDEAPAEATSNGSDLSGDLQKRAEDGQKRSPEDRTSRILEYFNKS